MNVSAGPFAIVVARFYEDLAERLVRGARGAFAEAGNPKGSGRRPS